MIWTRYLTSLLLLTVAATLMACPGAEPRSARATDQAAGGLPHWSFAPEMIFPADRSLMRPEDGVALPDGRLIVADQAHGLRVILPDGSHRPFGRFAQAGYIHEPPHAAGGANGVTLEPAGTHILVSDVLRGRIYRVEILSEGTELLYQHSFGVNTARRDGRGGVWFSQSTRNTPANGEAELWRAVDVPVADGAVYFLPGASGSEAGTAVRVADSLYFANGIALDEQAGYLYLAETIGGRVLRFGMDVATGQLTDRTVSLEILGPDNLELDPQGRLWIAGALRNEIVVLDLESGVARSVFRVSTPRSEALVRDIERRLQEGTPWLHLHGPDLWEPAPGVITGLILSPDGGPVYVTGLGDALIRLER